ncbi:MAG: low molecular weight phosphatase family protein [Caulobacterales bacterium]|nr:low molecular weight phosphatase family protein [Caulobacterales bacterium]
MTERPPAAILFACNLNSIRSPMAEGLMRRLAGPGVRVASCGIWEGGYLDGFMVEAMSEAGVSMADHQPSLFEDFDLGEFDLIVALTPDSRARAQELVEPGAPEVEYWPVPDPSGDGDSREARMAAYRATRDAIAAKIAERFPGVSTQRE